MNEASAAWSQHLELKRLLADIRLDLLCLDYLRKYRPDQPRVPGGNPDGGQWTDSGSDDEAGEDQVDQPFATATDQQPRSDLSELQNIADDQLVSSEIRQAWNASDPHGASPREHGFWICRNETTGEFFTRPFANPGSAARIVPGPVPEDAIAFFHTHPNSPNAGFVPGPSASDLGFAANRRLPGLLMSHNGMYYFGPSLRPRRAR